MKKAISILRSGHSRHGLSSFLLWFVFAVFLQGVAGCLTWPTFPSMKRATYWNGPYEVLVSDSGEIAMPIWVLGKGLLVSDLSGGVAEDPSPLGTPAYLYADGPAFQEFIQKRLPREVDSTGPNHVDVAIDDLGQGVWFLISAEEARQANRWFSVELDKNEKGSSVRRFANPDHLRPFQNICFPYKVGNRVVELSLSTENSRTLGYWW